MSYLSRKQKAIARRKRRLRVEQLLNKGVTNQRQIAAAIGTSLYTVNTDIKWIEERWLRNDPKQVKRKRASSINRLNALIHTLWNDYERSRQPTTTSTVKVYHEKCSTCRGTGVVRQDDNEDWCETCNGNGKIRVEEVSHKETSKCGDVAYLKEIRECQKLIAQLEGQFPSKRRELKVKGAVVHARIGKESEEFEGAPAELLFAAMSAVEQAREKAKEARTLDVEWAPKKPENENEENER